MSHWRNVIDQVMAEGGERHDIMLRALLERLETVPGARGILADAMRSAAHMHIAEADALEAEGL